MTLYGSLAATGRGHLTDRAIQAALAPRAVEILWQPETVLPLHPNGMEFSALDAAGAVLATWRVYSPGGGALAEEGQPAEPHPVYPLGSMQEILKYCTQNGKTFWEFVEENEGPEIWEYLRQVNQVMHQTIERGLHAEGVLPGGLGVRAAGLDLYAQDQAERRGAGQRRVHPGLRPGDGRRKCLRRAGGDRPHLRFERRAAGGHPPHRRHRQNAQDRTSCARWRPPG